MTPTYAEAVATLTEALRASDEIGAPEVYCTRETARALLAGPLEPSEEEVARAIGYCFGALVSRNPMPHMSGDPRARLEPHIRRQFDSAASEAAQVVQALYRSRHG